MSRCFFTNFSPGEEQLVCSAALLAAHRVYLTLSSGSGSLSLSSAFLFVPLLSGLLLGHADDWSQQKEWTKKKKSKF